MRKIMWGFIILLAWLTFVGIVAIFLEWLDYYWFETLKGVPIPP